MNWRVLLPRWSAAAALRAVRAVVVVCGLFAITHEVIGNAQMATFAAFGGFATLVLSSFSGSRRDKLLAHAGLAVAGSVLLVIATAAAATSTAVVAIVTVPVTFCVFFAGVAGPNAASGVTGALLAYVLPAASPSTTAMIPDRLAGWWLASVAATAAVLLLSPRPPADALRAAASQLADCVAEQLDGALAGTASRLDGVIEAKHRLLTTFVATPYRPTGLASADQALSNGVQLMEWCGALVIDAMRERDDLSDADGPDRELLGAASATLRTVAAMLAGKDSAPDLAALERARERSAQEIARRAPDGDDFQAAAKLSFHAQAIAIAARGVGADMVVASRRETAQTIAVQRERWFGSVASLGEPSRRLAAVTGAKRAAVSNASVRSVWFINSARGALALGAAVAIADVSNLQHGFWVVLGTLSVLRSNAAATGSTALRALAGTVIGFVIGGALLLAIGAGSTALWVVLPVAVVVAAYAPGTAPFAVGQAAFTVVVAVLFNLIAPIGWKVGVVRIEDVAIGCAVSVAVGTLFWPRGVSSVVGDDLADVFRAGASYLTQAVEWACGTRGRAPDDGPRVATTGARLDDALRGFLAEQGAKRMRKEQLWRLIGGSLRLRLTASALAGLPPGIADVRGVRDALDDQAQELASAYERIASQVGRPRGSQLLSARELAAFTATPAGDGSAPGGGRAADGTDGQKAVDRRAANGTDGHTAVDRRAADGADGQTAVDRRAADGTDGQTAVDRRAADGTDGQTAGDGWTASRGAPEGQNRWTIWVQESLDHLQEHVPELVEPATHIGEIRRRPWWR